MVKITAIYCRVSTNHQKLDSQEDELQRWIDLHNPPKVKWFKDKFTGKTMQRANVQKMIELMHQGKIDTIVVWRLDRLGRTASGLTKLFDELRNNKCNLISIRDHLDLSTPAGRLNANIIASVAAYETEVRGERVRAGQEAARARGKRVGGSLKGVRKKKVGAKVNAVLALVEKGVSKAEISRSVGISIPTVYSIIRDKGK